MTPFIVPGADDMSLLTTVAPHLTFRKLRIVHYVACRNHVTGSTQPNASLHGNHDVASRADCRPQPWGSSRKVDERDAIGVNVGALLVMGLLISNCATAHVNEEAECGIANGWACSLVRSGLVSWPTFARLFSGPRCGRRHVRQRARSVSTNKRRDARFAAVCRLTSGAICDSAAGFILDMEPSRMPGLQARPAGRITQKHAAAI